MANDANTGVPITAPDSMIAAVARHLAGWIGAALLAHGFTTSNDASTEALLTQIIAGVLLACVAMITTWWNQHKVTKTIVAANQLPAAPPGTPPAAVVAAATTEVKKTEGGQP